MNASIVLVTVSLLHAKYITRHSASLNSANSAPNLIKSRKQIASYYVTCSCH